MEMWQILVPTEMEREGIIKPIHTRYHKVWDAKVKSITHGLTILRPSIGYWVSPTNVTHKEKMIPVNILCTKEQIEEIIDYSLKYYNQEAILAYKISEEAILKHRKE